jgi:hypothetical protein
MFHKRKIIFRTKSKKSKNTKKSRNTKKNKGGMFSLLSSRKINLKPEDCVGETMNTKACREALQNKKFAKKVQKLYDEIKENDRRSSLQNFMEEEYSKPPPLPPKPQKMLNPDIYKRMNNIHLDEITNKKLKHVEYIGGKTKKQRKTHKRKM